MQKPYPEPSTHQIMGFTVHVDDALGHLWVEHEGAISWDEMQGIKNLIWGEQARAIEVYPAQPDVINNACIRHLWRLGSLDFAPDLLGRVPATQEDALQHRVTSVWAQFQNGK